MKSSVLLKNVRALFGFLRALAIIGLVVYPAAQLLSYFTSGDIIDTTAEVAFKTPPITLKAHEVATKASKAVAITDLKGEIHIPNSIAKGANIHRFASIASDMITILVGFLLAHWLWQLFRNAEKGEVFSSGNLALLRRVGLLMVAAPVALGALDVWTAAQVAQLVRDGLVIGGLEVAEANIGRLAGYILEHCIGDIINGLIVLCLVEVFRQGLQLKQDSDLTV